MVARSWKSGRLPTAAERPAVSNDCPA